MFTWKHQTGSGSFFGLNSNNALPRSVVRHSVSRLLSWSLSLNSNYDLINAKKSFLS